MLILTRRPGERVVIGDEVLVTVMSVSGHTVRLGIEAPSGVSIYREEIWLAVREENRAAAEAADPGAIPEIPPKRPAAAQAPPDDAPKRPDDAQEGPGAEQERPGADPGAGSGSAGREES